MHYIEQGDGQPVIFIHGGLDDYQSWQFQMGSFSRKYRAISYNRRFAYPNKWIGNVAQDNTIEDVKKITTIPTLIVKGELSPKFLLRIVDILSDNMPNTEQILIPNVSQGLGLMSRQQHL